MRFGPLITSQVCQGRREAHGRAQLATTANVCERVLSQTEAACHSVYGERRPMQFRRLVAASASARAKPRGTACQGHHTPLFAALDSFGRRQTAPTSATLFLQAIIRNKLFSSCHFNLTTVLSLLPAGQEGATRCGAPSDLLSAWVRPVCNTARALLVPYTRASDAQ